MADYERRLKALEEREAPSEAEARQAYEEMLKQMEETDRRIKASPFYGEPLPPGRPSDYDPEFKKWWDALVAEAAASTPPSVKAWFAAIAKVASSRK